MNTDKSTLQTIESDPWVGLAAKGVANAITGLSGMVGKHIETSSLRARRMEVKDAASLAGGPEACTVGVYLGVSGCASGHVLMIYQPGTAFDLVDMLLENSKGTTRSLGEMEQSVLGEVGNVMGAFFMNAVADATGLSLRVSPPAVIMDMAGAVLDSIVADILQDTDHALVVDTTFGTEDSQVFGTFLVLPSFDLQQALIAYKNGGK